VSQHRRRPVRGTDAAALRGHDEDRSRAAAALLPLLELLREGHTLELRRRRAERTDGVVVVELAEDHGQDQQRDQ